MLSVIIATFESELALVPTLAALVPGAMEGVISEVLVIDGGSHDDTAKVADVAGCKFWVQEAPLAKRYKAAAAVARARWLFFLRPGTILDAAWTGEVIRFVGQSPPGVRAAIFGVRRQPGLRQAVSRLAGALGTSSGPGQGLIISKSFYEQIGGHSETARDPEADLVRRVGRRRIMRFASIAATAR